ncbi:4-hydroxy-tetrahydrodipicolinate synthase [Roseivirga spongicola]|uniref:4-hydroxy-tetrahydrodipicolinate synthase n=1 Tax=Roseivirga spongicola TaxID=333140 RepID=A0A150X660_9BACT|nr:4-hydroxy-tetrahydrodipicolinate synthase [Roseivirga spongicola]KYG74200.1 4-hydroxy-tetrahydrodipicolinate synthase [Roseivirga spongicola]WPZ09136.1 4-hydroxy-tetrahydrodipicolinate synthase [Roseivirga spongicola]
MEKLYGTGVALVTPFTNEGLVDYDGLKRVLDFTALGVDYFVVMGTTGEVATVTRSEKKAVLAFARANNPKNLPIVYGIGGNNTAAVIEEIKDTDLKGVDAILSVSPYYNKPSQRGIVAHFKAIADASPVPVILYNVPGRTMSNMTAETTLELAKHPNIIGMKEASGNLEQCKAIADGKPEDFLLLSGEDLLTDEIIKLGGKGVISVLANGFPEEFSSISKLALNGDFEGAKKITESFKEINPLMYAESNPVGVKEVLRLKEICGNQVRLPLVSASDELKKQIADLV